MSPAPSGPEVEYQLGAKVLPWTGAIVLIVALGYLIAAAIERGMITHEVQFAGSMLLSAAFIVVGFWKREEREEFGKLLIGIGSCGIYLSLAGGYEYHRLYKGEALVALFTAWSFVNLAFGYWSNSRSFVVLGFIGGLAAALMPLKEDKAGLSAALHFAIVVPSLFISAKSRWKEIIIALTCISGLALIPLLSTNAPWNFRVAVLYANTLVCLTGYAFAYEPYPFDPKNALTPSVLFLTGLIGLGLRNDAWGTQHLLILASLGVALSFAFKKSETKNGFLLGSACVALVLSPFGFREAAPPAIFASLAIVCSLASLRFAPMAAISIAWVELALAFLYYGARMSIKEFYWQKEVGLLLEFCVAMGVVAWATNRIRQIPETFFVLATIVIVPVFSRVIWLVAGLPESHLDTFASLLFFWAFCASAIVALSKERSWSGAIALAWCLLIACLVVYPVITQEKPFAAGTDIFFLLALIGAFAFAGLGTAPLTEQPANKEMMAGLVGAAIAAMLLRVGFILLTLPAVGLSQDLALAYSVAAVTALLLAAFWRLRWISLAALSWIGLAIGLFAYGIAASNSRAVEHELALIAINFIEAILCAILTLRLPVVRDAVFAGAVLLTWTYFSRAGVLILTSTSFRMEETWALTICWTLYGAGLIALGFAVNERTLRYWSFAVFGITVAKVFLVDLAQRIDPLGRVAILMALGLAMLIGGYWYIRTQAPKNKPDIPSPLKGEG